MGGWVDGMGLMDGWHGMARMAGWVEIYVGWNRLVSKKKLVFYKKKKNKKTKKCNKNASHLIGLADVVVVGVADVASVIVCIVMASVISGGKVVGKWRKVTVTISFLHVLHTPFHFLLLTSYLIISRTCVLLSFFISISTCIWHCLFIHAFSLLVTHVYLASNMRTISI